MWSLWFCYLFWDLSTWSSEKSPFVDGKIILSCFVWSVYWSVSEPAAEARPDGPVPGPDEAAAPGHAELWLRLTPALTGPQSFLSHSPTSLLAISPSIHLTAHTSPHRSPKLSLSLTHFPSCHFTLNPSYGSHQPSQVPKAFLSHSPTPLLAISPSIHLTAQTSPHRSPQLSSLTHPLPFLSFHPQSILKS